MSHVRIRALAVVAVLATVGLFTGPDGMLSWPGGILAAYLLALGVLFASRRRQALWSRAAGDLSRASAFSTPDSTPPGSTIPS
jgi:hypothetical protein